MWSWKQVELALDRVGTWSLPLRAACWSAVLCAVLLLGYGVDLQRITVRITQQKNETQRLQNDYRETWRRVIHLNTYRQQMTQIQDALDRLLMQLPESSEIASLLEKLSQLGVSNGLEFLQITLLPEEPQAFYSALPIRMVVKGHFHQLAQFVSEMSLIPRVVTVHDFTIQSTESRNVKGQWVLSNDGRVKMDMVATTYRYVPDRQQVAP